MFYAIVFLPLLGAIVAGLIALAGAAGRNPAGVPALEVEDHAGDRVDEAQSQAAHARDGVDSDSACRGEGAFVGCRGLARS